MGGSGRPYCFVYSKIMCWVALGREITIAERYGFPGDLDRWRKTKDRMKEEVLVKGWNQEKESFAQHYDTVWLDSSNLLLPLLGFLPADDARVVSTIETTRRELGHEGLLYRSKGGDGLPGGEGAFLLCAFSLIDSLIATGRTDEAETLLRRMEKTANSLRLFPEEHDME